MWKFDCGGSKVEGFPNGQLTSPRRAQSVGHKVGVCCRNLLHVVIMSLITECGVLYLEVPLFCMENLPVPAAAAIAAAAVACCCCPRWLCQKRRVHAGKRNMVRALACLTLLQDTFSILTTSIQVVYNSTQVAKVTCPCFFLLFLSSLAIVVRTGAV